MNQNKKALFMLAVAVLLIGGFLTFLLSSSPISGAIKVIRDCKSINDVKNAYDAIDDNRVKTHETLVKEVRDKINSFHPNEAEIINCVAWLPPRPVSINLVIVPDLSNRIDPAGHFPDQAKVDTELFREIWQSFKLASGPKKQTKDKIAIDVTDNGQIDGEFRKIADNAIISLSNSDPKLINEFYFDKVGNSFLDVVDTLYSLSTKTRISGANFWVYFNQYLHSRHYQKSTIYDEIQNKVIILTDGYIEFNGGENLTPIDKDPKLNPIKPCNQDYSDWSILVCEVRERKIHEGKGISNKLKMYWHDWLSKMKFKNVDDLFFIEHNMATTITNKKIREFISSTDHQSKRSDITMTASANDLKYDNDKCRTTINTLINGTSVITSNNIDALINSAFKECGTDEIVIDDDIIPRSLKGFLLTKSNQSHRVSKISIEGEKLTIKVQKI